MNYITKKRSIRAPMPNDTTQTRTYRHIRTVRRRGIPPDPDRPEPWYLRKRAAATCTIPRTRAMATTNKPPEDDAWATKYCFSAKITVYAGMRGAPIGVIFGFDRTPEISRHVEMVARSLEEDTGYVMGDTEMVMHRECPMEITSEVYVQMFNEERGSGSQDEDDRSAL